MYTDEQIAKMKQKMNPAIKTPKSWNIVLTEKEYDKKLKELLVWVSKESAYVEKKHNSDLFPKFVSPLEIIPFLKAGFELDFDYISDLTYRSEANNYLPFLEQDLAIKLAQIRESITTITVTLNALATLNSEFGSDYAIIKEKSMEILKLAKDSLTLLAQGEMGQIGFFSKIETVMKQDCKSDKIPTATYIKILKSIKHHVNTVVYKEKTKSATKNSEETSR